MRRLDEFNDVSFKEVVFMAEKSVRKAGSRPGSLRKTAVNGAARRRVTAALEPKEEKPAKPPRVSIPAPEFEIARFKIRGNAPYVQNAFSQKAIEEIRQTQIAGETAKKGKKRKPKDFKGCYEASQHKSPKGWHGIPAPAFRAAMISACKIVGFHMTKAKLSVFVIEDGLDRDGTTPLVKITKGKPKHVEHYVRPEKGGVDIRARAMFEPGWEATVAVRFDTEQFTLADIANLMMRVGLQVGVGEGRPDSRKGTGMGWGTFELVE